jgi:hypothetical protein
MFKDDRYEITVFVGSKGLDPLDDNVDVEVAFDDGSRFVATFFTLQNIEKILDRYKQTGECMKGFYFWCSDMIIVRSLSRESITKVVGDLIEKGEFEEALTRVPPSSQAGA